MQSLNNSGMREELDRLFLKENVPVLGVCVGMQMMATGSEEGVEKGLNWIDATVLKFPKHCNGKINILPHMGWNVVQKIKDNPLFNNLSGKNRYYFLHTYFIKCDKDDEEIAVTNYCSDFIAAIRKNNIYGVQFHPEKSHKVGMDLLKNFYYL